MWTAEIQDGNVTVSSTTTGTSNDHKRLLDLSVTEAKVPSPNVFTPTSECSADKRRKTNHSCEIHGKKYQKPGNLMKEAVRKWQLCNLAKCIFENTVNLVLESMPDDNITSRQETLNTAHHNFNVENEAVLMAIEEHGLRKQNLQCSCPETSIQADSLYCNTDFYERMNPNTPIDTYFSNEENPEFNFENNFLATAVSAAIEEKGLSMYHV